MCTGLEAWRPAEKEHTLCPRLGWKRLAQAGRGSTQKSLMSCELGGSWKWQESEVFEQKTDLSQMCGPQHSFRFRGEGRQEGTRLEQEDLA